MQKIRVHLHRGERIYRGMGNSKTRAIAPTTIFRYSRRHPLNAFFEPKSIAIIGATEQAGSVGRTLLWNLLSHPFGGTIFPINPRHSSILGIKAYPRLSSLPEPV